MNQTDTSLKSHGLLIMLDGPDGVGKSTQVEMASKALSALGHEVYATRLSGGTPIGEALRKVSLNPDFERSVETDLYIILAMYRALADDLRQRQAAGIICIVDRSPLSIIAYQVFGSGLPLDVGEAAVADALELFKPDLVLCYDAPEATLNAHRNKRSHNKNALKPDFFESQPPEYMHRVIAGYHEASRMYEVQAIDASGSSAEVHKTTMQHIDQLLNLS